MTTHETSYKWLRHTLPAIALVAVALAVLLLPGLTSGQEVEQTGLRPLPPGEVMDAYEVPADETTSFAGSPQVIPMASFVGVGNSTGSYQTTYIGFINSKADNTQVCYVAPVYLPDGATVTAMDTYFMDNTQYQLEVYLLKKPYLAGAPQSVVQMATIYSLYGEALPRTDVQHWVDATINDPVVDNNTYHYYVDACPWHTQHQILSVRVFYTK